LPTAERRPESSATIPDPAYSAYQALADGDIQAAIAEGFEHLLRTLAPMAARTVRGELLFVYGVSLTLAHQNFKQFKLPKIDALLSTGSTIVFNVDARDAAILGKDFQEKAQVNDFLNLDVGDAMVRIGSNITRIKTLGPEDIPARHFRDQIISHSRETYCRPTQQVHAIIAERSSRPPHPFTPLTSRCNGPTH